MNQSSKTVPATAAFLLSAFVLHGCAPQQPRLNASQYRFKYHDQAYRIRSISPETKAGAYNELIGEDLVAADFDQDQILDRIVLGDVNLSAAQKIYEYGLAKLRQENKLQVQAVSVKRYMHEGCDFTLEMTSFRPAAAPPFNELRMMDKRQPSEAQAIVLIDHDADGRLDAILKGTVNLEQAQAQYAEIIATGLRAGRLIRSEHAILVKE